MQLEIAEKHGVSAAQVALAWMLQKPGVTSIIIGAKKMAQLNDNIAATSLKLTSDEIEKLDAVSALTPEYPAWMVERQMRARFPEDQSY